MKKTYEVPKLMIEMFTPNAAIAACAVNKEWEFDCMKGDKVDLIDTAVAEYSGLSCDQNVGISTTARGARDYSGGANHTSKNGSWSLFTVSGTQGAQGRPGGGMGSTGVQVIYSGIEAVLYCDSQDHNQTPSTTNWTDTETLEVNGESITFMKREGDGLMHHLVAPVKSVAAMS